MSDAMTKVPPLPGGNEKVRVALQEWCDAILANSVHYTDRVIKAEARIADLERSLSGFGNFVVVLTLFGCFALGVILAVSR